MSTKTLHFVDPVTRLPHYVAILPALERWLREDSALGMLSLSINGLDRLEEMHGPKVFDKVLREIAKILKEMAGDVIRKHDEIAVSDIGGTGFMVFLSEKREARGNDRLQKRDVEIVADRVQEHLFPKLFELLYKYTHERPRLSVGYSFVVHNPLIRLRRLIHRLIDEAQEMAYFQYPRTEVKSKERLQRIILEEQVKTVFQPIVNIQNGKVIGYEALSRGPEGTVFEPPLLLFSMARDAGLVFELDRLCRRKSLAASRQISDDKLIFINTLPHTIHDPEFRGKYLEAFLKDIDKKPDNIVFELTERAAIENYASFRDAMNYYTDIGVSIAIDDAGTGYSTLEAIVELNPKYLKFDISMVRGIGKSSLKQEMLQMLKGLADRIDATIIAEGIENKEDLVILQRMEIELGQGFYFAKPLSVEEVLKVGGSIQSLNRKKALTYDKT